MADTLVLLVSEAVMQLLLIQDDHQSFVTVVLHCLCTEQFSVKCGGRCVTSLAFVGI